MELDSRIKSIDDIQTILHHDVDCIGSKGYFFDEFVQTKDLSKCRYGELIDITTHDDRNDLCFKAEYQEGFVGFYRFFIPEKLLKPIEKKYRPYTIKDFEKAFMNEEFEDFIIFRDKHEPDNIYTMRYNGNYTRGKYEYICLGAKNFSFENLFENYEVADYDGDWQPFGVEVSRDENQREV